MAQTYFPPAHHLYAIVYAIVNVKTGRHLVDKLELTSEGEVRSVPEIETGTRLCQDAWRLEHVGDEFWRIKSRTGRHMRVRTEVQTDGSELYKLQASNLEYAESANHEWEITRAPSSHDVPASFWIRNLNTKVIIHDQLPEGPILFDGILLKKSDLDLAVVESEGGRWILKEMSICYQ